MSAKGLGGWVQKMAIFADVQYCIYADIVGGWVRKSPKMCWRNIRIVLKGVSGLKCRLDYSYHHERRLWNFHFILASLPLLWGWRKKNFTKQIQMVSACPVLRWMNEMIFWIFWMPYFKLTWSWISNEIPNKVSFFHQCSKM